MRGEIESVCAQSELKRGQIRTKQPQTRLNRTQIILMRGGIESVCAQSELKRGQIRTKQPQTRLNRTQI